MSYLKLLDLLPRYGTFLKSVQKFMGSIAILACLIILHFHGEKIRVMSFFFGIVYFTNTVDTMIGWMKPSSAGGRGDRVVARPSPLRPKRKTAMSRTHLQIR